MTRNQQEVAAQQQTNGNTSQQPTDNPFRSRVNDVIAQPPSFLDKNRIFVADVKKALTQMSSSTSGTKYFPTKYYTDWFKPTGLNQKVRKIMRSYYNNKILHPNRHHDGPAKEIANYCNRNPKPDELFLFLMQQKKALDSMNYKKEGSFHCRLMFCIDRVKREENLDWNCAENHHYNGQ